MKNHIIKLLKLEQHLETIDSLLDAAIGGTIWWPVDKDIDSPFEIALDMLGVPADNTVELDKKYGDKACERQDYFCRDSYYWDWGELKGDPNRIEKFIKQVADRVF